MKIAIVFAAVVLAVAQACPGDYGVYGGFPQVNCLAPRTIAENCQCTKTVVRPQVCQQVVNVPTTRPVLQSTVSPVIENIPYSTRRVAPLDLPYGVPSCGLPVGAPSCGFPSGVPSCGLPLGVPSYGFPLGSPSCGLPLGSSSCSLPLGVSGYDGFPLGSPSFGPNAYGLGFNDAVLGNRVGGSCGSCGVQY